MAELVALVKGKPGHCQYASVGNDTLNCYLGDQLATLFASLPWALSHIQTGKLRGRAVSGLARPLVLAKSVPCYNGRLWEWAVRASRRAARSALRRQEGMGNALAAKDLRATLEKQGMKLTGQPGAFCDILAARRH